MTTPCRLFAALLVALSLAACGESPPPAGPADADEAHAGESDGTHTHADGTVHRDDHGSPAGDGGVDLAADEVSLGAARVGAMTVELAQGHGPLRAGQESHLVVKLPDPGNGGHVVRAWIGTEDRTRSFVGQATYSAAHGDYDVHATAPDPLPDGVRWWIEIETPDGRKAIGSAEPRLP